MNTSMNAIQMTETLRQNFIRYLLTTFNVERSDVALGNAIRRNLEAPGVLFRGPFLELNPPYTTGASIRELANEGIVNKALCRLREDMPVVDRPLPPDRPLYSHQEKAVRTLLSEQRNIVVASGTGSGKTECFLIPILHDLLSDPAPGVRALLIYPMNALVNDQLDRLRNLLAGTNITFGRYTSELKKTDAEGKKANPTAPANEVISRETIRGNPNRGIAPNPPQILITNYAMLEYLLLRPEDSPIFDTSRLQFLCLDEAHTYTGAQGIEVSMLLRRLKQRLEKRRGEIRCIATSATLTENDRAAAASFASSLFGEDFLEKDVIFGNPLDLTTLHNATDPTPTLDAWLQLSGALRERLRQAIGSGQKRNVALIAEAAAEFLNCKLATPERIATARQQAGDNVSRFLYAVFQANPQLAQLRQLMRKDPIELHEAGQALFGAEAATREQAEDELTAEAVCRLVEIGAMARESADTVPLLPARYHLFARAPQGAWLCLNPNCKAPEGTTGWSHLFLSKREQCPHCNAAAFELTACRNCGQPYVRAFRREGIYHTEGRFESATAGQRYFTWQPLTFDFDANDESETQEGADTSSSGKVEICLHCRRHRDDCHCHSDACLATLHQIEDANGQPKETLGSCPRCQARTFAQREIVTSIKVGSSAPLAVLTEELYRLSPPSPRPEIRSKSGEGRKLLTFADSRQGAARYAAYLQSSVDSTLYRHLIAQAAVDLNQKGRVPDLEDLADQCVTLAEQYGLYGEQAQYATGAERRRRKQEAVKRIMAEFGSRTDPRHSLWALGLVGCDVHFPSDILPDESLCTEFGLAPQTMMTVLQALLDTVRLDKAVTMPDGVDPRDEIFGHSNATIYYRLSGSTRSQYEKNWVSDKEQYAQRQARFDYVRRILMAGGKSAEVVDVQDALMHAWQWINRHRVFVGTDSGACQINYQRLIFPAGNQWYRCNRCLRLSTRFLGEDLCLCPSRGCEGQLEPFEAGEATEDHYRALFSRTPVAMRVEEHTAQLQPEAGREYQEKFIKGDINVLSCSTTFEMGVDVGELQTVVLNNVPPGVANYRQRAGRAGRRASGAAFILTYAAPRPHDRVYFSNPTRIIAGEVAVPQLAVNNRIILGRHLKATLLGHFFRWLSQQGRTDIMRTGAFFAPNLPDGRHVDFLEQWRNERTTELNDIIQNFFLENPDAERQTTEAYINQLTAAVTARCQDFERWVSEYDRLCENAIEAMRNTRDRNERENANKLFARFAALRDRLFNESLIDFLCREGVLPSYSFPIDLVALRLPAGRQYRDERYANEWLRLERDKKIAIVEYAPGAEIVADKHLWRSVGVTIREELNDYEYRVCETCRHLDRSERGGLPISGACRVCGNSDPGDSSRYIDPDGFTTDLSAGLQRAGLQVDTGVNRSRSFLLATGQNVREETISVNDCPYLHYAYRRDGELVSINSGEDPDGFWICGTCGIHVPPPKTTRRRQQPQRHATPWGEKGCSGTPQPGGLGHAFKSDTLHLRFENTKAMTLPAGQDLSFWRSLTYALLEGASLALQIERRDLDGVVRPFTVGASVNPEENFSQEIVLFDNVPGGAGHVRQIAENLEAVLRQALVVAQCPECEEETSCPNCLRNYGNQIYWEELKRGPVARFLESVIHETFPAHLDHLAVGAAFVSAIDKPRWLAQELLAAEQEVYLAVASVTRDRPQGLSQHWLEVLQELRRRNVSVTLLLTELPPANRMRPEEAGLLNHLSLLVRDGLQLRQLQNGARPEWNCVIDPAGSRCRAISICDKNKQLNEQVGKNGLVTTINAAAVKTIAAQWQNFSAQTVRPEALELPPHVQVIHVREGELITEAGLFRGVFRRPLKSLWINDRFLRSDHHEQRLRAYLELIVTESGTRPQITIETLAAEINLSPQGYYYHSSQEQQQMFARLKRDFPLFDIHYQLASRLPHDRFLQLRRTDGTSARIGIGAGLDFIRYNGRTKMTDILIEDPHT
ncbi:MAG: DEAD/DEAH box helicase [Blastocatellia bacterium]|nr:DEAD/DEAH box helicase [Blastocatellia bacterium]